MTKPVGGPGAVAADMVREYAAENQRLREAIEAAVDDLMEGAAGPALYPAVERLRAALAYERAVGR